MRILFLNPSSRNTIFGKMKTLSLPPMGLVGIASVTPPEHEVSIFDENVEEGPGDLAVELDADPLVDPADGLVELERGPVGAV